MRESAPIELAALEIDLLMQAMAGAYAFNATRLPRQSVEAAAATLVRESGVRSVTGLVERVLHEPAFGRETLRVLCGCDVPPFRDALFHRNVREQVLPWLRTYPYSNVWLAQCGAGGEAYSFVILLAETGLLDRVVIHATDSDPVLLGHARQGTIPLDALDAAEADYQRAGGMGRLGAYFERQGDHAVLRDDLLRRIVWAEYDVTRGHTFNEFHFIVCRESLAGLPDCGRRALRLLTDSLSACGLLKLNDGPGRWLDAGGCYKSWRPGTGIHQRTC